MIGLDVGQTLTAPNQSTTVFGSQSSQRHGVDRSCNDRSGDAEKVQVFRDAIDNTRHRGLSGLRIKLADHSVLLSGTVSSYYLKQVAQESIRPYAIGLTIRNELKVTDP